MRATLTILAVAAALPIAAQTTKKPTTTHRATTTRKTTAGAKAVSTPVTPPVPGLAAVGEMPAVTGAAAPLYALQYVDIKTGTGDLAQPNKWYAVHYTGWTTDGKKFDSSYDHPGAQPFIFPAGGRRVITAWDTGFEGMRIGGKRRLIVPYQLGYGEAGHPPVIPEKATLIFDIEFLGQGDDPQKLVAPPAAPSESKPATDSSKPADSTQK